MLSVVTLVQPQGDEHNLHEVELLTAEMKDTIRVGLTGGCRTDLPLGIDLVAVVGHAGIVELTFEVRELFLGSA